MGSIIFNATYAEALGEVHTRLRDAGVALRLSFRDCPCWATVVFGEPVSEEFSLDATFVDDECIVIMSK